MPYKKVVKPTCHYRDVPKAEGFQGFLTRLPLHEEMEAVGDLPLAPGAQDAEEAEVQTAGPKSLPATYPTRQGRYVWDSVIGEYGGDVERGQLRKVTGLAVDESSGTPLVLLTETKVNYILAFRLSGRLQCARRVQEQVRDVCTGPAGSVVVTVAERDFALAQWDSCLMPGACRLENLFRANYGHAAIIASEPWGVARDARGRYLVTMLAKDRVCVWDERRVGDHIAWYGDGGQGRMRFNGPYHVAKMACGLTVVACTNDHKVKVVDEARDDVVLELGGPGCGLPDLCYPRGVCLDSHDNIYIADTGNFRVVTYSRQGDFLGCPVSETWNYGRDVKPTTVAVMADGRLLVVMQGHLYCRVHVYRPARGGEEECECSCTWSRCVTGCCCRAHGDYEALD
ncbi:hypothetical protein ACOMHN_031299 [Nucella lapillus]